MNSNLFSAVKAATYCILSIGLLLAPDASAQHQLAWQAPAPNSQSITVSPDGTVHIVDNMGVLRSFSPEGTVKASLSLGNALIGDLIPTPGGGFVAITEGNRLVSVSPDLKIRWEKTLEGRPTGQPEVGPDGTVYLNIGSTLHAYNSTGTVKWTYDSDYPLTASPAASTAGIAIAPEEGGIIFVSLTGQEKYNYEVVETVARTIAVSDTGRVSFLNTDSQIEGLDAAGNPVWLVEPDTENQRFSLATSLNGTIYFVAGGNEVRAVTPAGETAWTYDVGSAVNAPLTITSDNRLLIGTQDNRLITLNLQGQEQGEVRVSSPPTGVAAASGGRYYVLIGSGQTGSTSADLLVALVPADNTPPLWVPSGITGERVFVLARHPQNPGIIYAGGNDTIWASRDAGVSWREITLNSPDESKVVNDIAVASDGRVYAVTPGSLYVSNASGENFGIVDIGDGLNAVAVNPANPDHVIFTSGTETYVFESEQGGSESLATFVDFSFTDLLWATENVLLAASNDGLYHRTAAGAWERIAEGPVYDLTASADGKTIYASGDARVLRSTNFGQSFETLAGDRFVGVVWRVAVQPQTTSQLMAGTVLPANTLTNEGIRGINLYASSNSGDTWVVRNKGLESVTPHDLLGGADFFLVATDDGILRIGATGGTTPEVMPGDLNGDKRVNVQDATLSLRIAVGLIQPTEAQRAAGDVNKDNKLNVQDSTLILRASVGLIEL